MDSSDHEEDASMDTETLNAIADDSIALFRVNLFLIVIYSTILSLILSQGYMTILERSVNSLYTINGAVFWFGSTVISLHSYRVARRTAITGVYANLGRIHDRYQIISTISTSAAGTLVAVISLIFGLIDGLGEGGVTVDQPILIVALSVVMVSFIFSFFSLLELVRVRWGPIRKILRMS